MIEVKKVSCRQDTHGEWFVTIKLHPDDFDDGLVKSQPGTVFNISYEVAEPEDILVVTKEDYTGKTEGERIRTRAVLLCKDERFQTWVLEYCPEDLKRESVEERVSDWLRSVLDIDSRARLATDSDAQQHFLELERRYREETGQVAEARG